MILSMKMSAPPIRKYVDLGINIENLQSQGFDRTKLQKKILFVWQCYCPLSFFLSSKERGKGKTKDDLFGSIENKILEYFFKTKYI